MPEPESLAHPPIVDRETWLAARVQLLEREKAHTREYDRLNALRRRLPMVPVPKPYRFIGEQGEQTLLDLFQGRRQLITYHFMFGPDWSTGCPGCTSWVNALGDMSLLAERDTTLVLVSRAPFPKLDAYRKERGWSWDWVSSGESDFNEDMGVTLDPSQGRTTYNYRASEPSDAGPSEVPGTSVFFRMGDEVFHTYSTFARGGEHLNDSYRLLDITPFGRQEDFEDSPAGWPQRPTYG